MKKETVKLTKGALQLVETESFAHVKFAEGDAEKKNPQLEMLAYSGGIIKGHWYWGDLAISMAGMTIPKKFPILEDHYTSQKIGFATKTDTEGNTKLKVTAGSFVETEESIKFRDLSGQGFPFQASIYAKPTKIMRLMEGESAEVNGFTMHGPGTIWLKSTLKEASVCTFGYDPNTSSAAMSEKDGEELDIEYEGKTTKFSEQEEVITMDMAQLKEKHPELVSAITKEVEAKFTEEKKNLETQLTEAQTVNTQLSEQLKDNTSRLQKLEKNELIRNEKFMEDRADKIFADKFSAAGISPRLAGKLRKLVNHEQFISDDKLDETKFSEAVAAELKEWEGTETESSVQGLSTAGREVAGDGKEEKLCDEAAERMLARLK